MYFSELWWSSVFNLTATLKFNLMELCPFISTVSFKISSHLELWILSYSIFSVDCTKPNHLRFSDFGQLHFVHLWDSGAKILRSRLMSWAKIIRSRSIYYITTMKRVSQVLSYISTYWALSTGRSDCTKTLPPLFSINFGRLLWSNHWDNKCWICYGNSLHVSISMCSKGFPRFFLELLQLMI